MAEKGYVSLDAAYDIGTLEDWYISSVSQDDAPVWTEEHLEELLNDFYVIPKDTPTVDVAPVKHGHWILTKRTKLVPTDKVGIKESFASSPINGTFVDENNINQKAMIMKKRITIIKPKCSECGYYGYDEDDITPYCPNCGCKLDNESEENNNG